MSSTLCQDFGPIRLLNCPFNSPGTTNDSQAATDNCEDNSGGSVDMSVWKACGECVPLSVLCTMYGSILSVMYGTSWREQDLKSLPSVRTECGNKVREMIATAGTEHHHFVFANSSSFVPALTHQRASRLWPETSGAHLPESSSSDSCRADNSSCPPCVYACSQYRYIYNSFTTDSLAAAFSIFLQFPNVWIYLMALMPHFPVGFVRNCSRCDSRRVIKICVPSRCNFFSNGRDRTSKNKLVSFTC